MSVKGDVVSLNLSKPPVTAIMIAIRTKIPRMIIISVDIASSNAFLFMRIMQP